MAFAIGIKGVTVGHSTNQTGGTGCTVVLVPGGAVASLDVRGGAPGTRETDLLSPYSSVGEPHAVVLTGGSAFGLAAADGVVTYLEEQGYGYQTPFGRVPLVAAAVIYDLGLGQAHARPRAEDGYRAAAGASSLVEEGCVGVGTGATVGKVLGEEGWMKSGFAAAQLCLPSGVTVAAFTVVNAFGDVLAEDGSVLAGARLEPGGGEPGPAPSCFLDTHAYLLTLADHPRFNSRMEHTTLSVVVTDARLTKTECSQVARMAHDGLARAVSPVHTPVDGDAVFVLSAGARGSSVFQLGAAAADVVAAGIRRAVRLAEGSHGVPALQDL
ncbi:MAG: P1 family peptidase [Actinobacteria bacterium]|nr:P1 family peptidase [Actinomycetota bacterium]